MQYNPPRKISIPFARDGIKNEIPDQPVSTNPPNQADMTSGFPSITMQPVSVGGKPPFGQDMNGALNLITQNQQFTNAGGKWRFDAAFATAIGGYPKGSVLQADDGINEYVSLVDNNTSNFNTDASSIGTSWIRTNSSANYNNSVRIDESITITPDQVGCFFWLGIVPVSGTITLPLSSECKLGDRLVITNTADDATNWGVVPQGSDELREFGRGAAVVSRSELRIGSVAEFVLRIDGSWHAYQGPNYLNPAALPSQNRIEISVPPNGTNIYPVQSGWYTLGATSTGPDGYIALHSDVTASTSSASPTGNFLNLYIPALRGTTVNVAYRGSFSLINLWFTPCEGY